MSPLLSGVAGVGLLVVAVRVAVDVGSPDGFSRFAIVAAFDAYVVAAEIVLRRARRVRGPTTRLAGGFAQWAPAFAWIPYGVIAFRIGPSLDAGGAARAIGLALAVGGTAFAMWALASIGRHFDLELEVHRDHEVVRSGPYAIVRHPIYAGLLLHTLGAAVATGSLVFAAGSLLVTVPVLYTRARIEERMLRADLGRAYADYAREVGMLVPFVGRRQDREPGRALDRLP